jgi:hypothetical protein
MISEKVIAVFEVVAEEGVVVEGEAEVAMTMTEMVEVVTTGVPGAAACVTRSMIKFI